MEYKVHLLTVLILISMGLLLTALPVNAATETITVASDGTTQWYDPSTGEWQNAIACWVDPSWPSIPGADYIWRTYYTDPVWEYNNVPATGWEFRKTFSIPANAYNISGTISSNADNAYQLLVNGNLVRQDGAMNKDGPDNVYWDTVYTDDVSGVLTAGSNEITVYALNYGYHDDAFSNPAGLVFEATITYSVPDPVSIDIKPGSYPNSINPGEQGLLPVAILGSNDTNVRAIDPSTIALDGVSLANRGKAQKLAYSLEDVNGDGYVDMITFFSVQDLVNAGALTQNTTQLSLTGALYDGTRIEGMDTVRVVPP